MLMKKSNIMGQNSGYYQMPRKNPPEKLIQQSIDPPYYKM